MTKSPPHLLNAVTLMVQVSTHKCGGYNPSARTHPIDVIFYFITLLHFFNFTLSFIEFIKGDTGLLNHTGFRCTAQ